MAYTQKTDFVFKHVNQVGSELTGDLATVKANLDSQAKELRDYINNVLLAEMASVTDGDSGADNIGATAISGLTGATVQALLQALKNKIDSVNPVAGFVNVKDPTYGAVGDGVTDDTAAIQAAFNVAYSGGGCLYFPSGTYLITSAIGIASTLTSSRAFPTIIGTKATATTSNLTGKVQDGSILLYDAIGGEALKIVNNSTTEFYYGGEIRGLSIIKKYGDKATDNSIGLSLKGCVDYRLFNVVSMGFDIGFKNDYGWSWDAFGLICVRNNIGVLLEDNSNAVGLHGSQIHQNNVNLKILSGTNILVNKATLEGSGSKGVVITKGTSSVLPSTIKFQSCYFEANAACFKIGKDENDVQSTSTIVGVTIEDCNFEVTGVVPLDLDNATDIELGKITWGHTTPLIATTSSTKRVSFKGFREQFETDIGDRYSASRRIGVFNRTNLLPNGFLHFPALTDFLRGGLTAAFDTTTFAGEKVVKITVPNGTATNVYTRIMVKIDKKMVGKRLIFGGTAQKDASLTAIFQAYTPAYAGISGASVAIPEAIGKVGFYFECPDEEYINISILLANSSGSTKYVYIKSMVLVERGAGEVEPNPLDYLSGFAGSVTGSVGGTVVPLTGWAADMYEVIVTPKANVTAYVTKAANQFTITTVGGDGAVAYLVIPKAGMLI